jgi:hypothetical protein
MPVFDICVTAQVTVFESMDLPITASTEEEAIELAHKQFRAELEDRYGWVDYDESHIESITKFCD